MKITFIVADNFYTDFAERNGEHKIPLYNMEEAAEYIQEVAKYAEGRGNKIKLIEEMADTLICMFHLMSILDMKEELLEQFYLKLHKHA